ncbi:hypothetical protein ISR94_02115 [Candidatus Microgenomates bacterium]|nr:hypothetical protein [Candidatus Microgenomates bacterium]
MLKVVSAYEARKNLGELMNLAYYSNYDIVVEKMGKPMVRIVKVTNPINKVSSRSDILKKYAGVWSVDDTEKIKKYTKSFRKSVKILK